MEIKFTPSLSTHEFVEAIEKLTDKTYDIVDAELCDQNLFGDTLLVFSHDDSPGWIYQAINEIVKMSGSTNILVYEN